MSQDEAWNDIRIGDRRVPDLEEAITQALAPLLGEEVQIQITKVTRTDDAVTALEMEALFEDEEEPTRFAIG